MHLDYSAIEQSPLYEGDRKRLNKSNRRRWWKIYLLFFPPFLFGYIGYLILRLPKIYRNFNTRQSALKSFADTNGFEYEKMRFIQSMKKPSASISLPYQVSVSHIHSKMSGRFNGLPFIYGNAYTERHNSNGAMGGCISLFRVGLPIHLPKLLVNSKFNNMPVNDLKADNFTEVAGYDLEGDFSESYEVLAEKDDQINVLSILTPEVMLALKENYRFDVWINGNKLYLLYPGLADDVFALTPKIFKTAEVLTKEIDKIARALRRQDYR